MSSQSSEKRLNRRFTVAPMLDWTDRHCRYFHRLLTRHALLYTEMVTTGALLHGDATRHLDHHLAEHPIALQLGGSDPDTMMQCAEMAEKWGYDEVNINVGCPSDRVQNGTFGACLMREPQTVASCVKAMQAAVDIPITVKCRIGVDEQDEELDLEHFIDVVANAGCETFIVHARKAWLQGLSPKQNRDIPPLNYPRVHRLKAAHPELEILINGGLETLSNAQKQLEMVDGVMFGRAAYQNPTILQSVDAMFYSDERPPRPIPVVIQKMAAYAEQYCSHGGRLNHVTRHMLGLFQGIKGAKQWRRHLSENAHQPNAGPEVLLKAYEFVAEATH